MQNVCTLNQIIMYRFRRDGVSVMAVMDTRRMKKNGLYPVKIEVVFRRRQKYFPTGKDVSREEWESFRSSRRLSEKEMSIEKTFSMVRNQVNELIDRGEFCFPQLETRLGHVLLTVNESLSEKMELAKETGRINTFYRYRSTLHALERYAGGNISFDSVTAAWLARCEAFWKREGKSSTTINIYMRSLRCVMKEASECGIIKHGHMPFGHSGYHIPAPQSRKMALSHDEIMDIKNWKGDAKCEYWRDMWMFSYLCNGINFRDMLFLRRSSIVDGEVTFVRSKTSSAVKRPKTIKAPLLDEMADIIERHGNGIHGPKDGMLFKHAKGREKPQEITNIVRNAVSQCNSALKIIAQDIGIGHISTYSARHSFATVLMKSGVDIPFISESLGHSDIRVTEAYLGCYDKDDRIRNSRKLL